MQQTKPKGYYGEFGGQYVPETLVAALAELETAFEQAINDETFKLRLQSLLQNFGGRPTPLYLARNLTDRWGGGKVYLKREDLNHTGAHKINNTIGQALLAERLGKRRVVAETGAGQHGVATAAASAMLGLECVIYMGSHDTARQKPNAMRIELLGGEIREVATGSGTLKEATSESIRDWVTNVEDTHYIIGSTVGPHPYPQIVKHFQSVIGEETKEQIHELEHRQPDTIIACVGGGSNAMGIFAPFLDTDVQLLGVESAGLGLEPGKHAATLALGEPGVLHGARTYLLQDENGQVLETTTVSAGLDYPGVGPEHSHLKHTHRVTYGSVTDAEALSAFRELCRHEGIIPALESSFALAFAKKFVATTSKDQVIVVNLSGRGDKDLENVRDYEQSH